MRKVYLIILMLSIALSGMAQYGSDQKKGRKEAVAVGIRFGGNLANYTYSDQVERDTLGFDTFMKRVRPIVGVNVEFPIGGIVYVAPEVALSGRGDARLFNSSIWDTLVSYQVNAYYLEFRLPVSIAVPVNNWLKPYVFASPAFGLTMPFGKISQYSHDPTSFNHAVSINASNMAPYDLSVLVGAGMRFTMDFTGFSLVIKTEAGYHFGFLDTYSSMEHTEQAQAVNVNAYNIVGTRKNRGIEASVSVLLPLRFYRDACSFGSRIY